MTTQQPAASASPSARTDVGVPEGLTKQIDDANQAVEAATRLASGRATARATALARAGQTGVIKDPNTGYITVTGPNNKAITIDPKAGLNPDQIQELVQNTLQPTPSFPTHNGPEIPPALIPIFGIVFPCLAIIVYFITRMFTARRTIAGSTTATLSPEAAARLARIEQAVEAVAIEVERISEAQRYSAQLLTDRLPTAGLTAPAIAASRADHG